MGWLFLALAISCEVTGTLALKASDGLSRLWPSVIVVVGYALTVLCLGICLKMLPLGTSYAIWAGVGTAAAAIGSLVLFHEKLSVLAIVGIVVIIVGVVLVTLATEHG